MTVDIDHGSDKPTLCLTMLIMMSWTWGSQVEGALTYVRLFEGDGR